MKLPAVFNEIREKMVKMNYNNNGMSMEGAYDEAIEVAARRIHLAIRPTAHETTITTSMNASHSSSSLSENEEADSTSSDDNDSSEQQVLDDANNSINDDSYDSNDDDLEDEDIESTIQFLQEKILILKKVEARRKNEEAYIACNAHEIMNGREPSHTNHVKSSSVWSEAKDLLEEYKIGVGGQGEVADDDEGEQQQQKRSLSPPPQQLQEQPSSSSNNNYNNILSSAQNFFPRSLQTATDEPKNKRLKIDLSFVKLISSTRFDVEASTDLVGGTTTTSMPPPLPTVSLRTSSNNLQNYDTCCNISPNIRCQQASDMQFATDSRRWISQDALQQISITTNTAIAKHRFSLI